MTTLKKLLHAAVLCSATILALSAAPAAYAQRGDYSQPRADSQFLYAFRDATAQASMGTVQVLCDGKPVALGTIVGADGWILTKNTLLKDGKSVTCKLKDGQTLDANVVGVKDDYDLAMLKVKARKLTPVKFTESKLASVGSWLATVGTSDDPLAVGVMSVAARKPTNRDLSPPPLDPNRGYLGINMEPAKGGIKITNVSERSGASRAGLKVNDIILSVNEQPIADTRSMQEIMSKTKPRDQVKLKIKRGEDEKEITVRLGTAPKDRSDIQNSMGAEEGLSDRRSGFPRFFQHDAVIKPKECGGPVCDLDGNVVGINIARVGRTETWAVPTEAILPLLPELQSGKLAPKTETTNAIDPDKKQGELKDALKKAEEAKAALDKKLLGAKDDVKKLEADRAAAEKKLKEAKDALDKAEKEKDKN